MNALQTIQQKLKAPKSQYNSFGKYHYRNCEDIQEAVKPLLAETNSVLTLTDEIVEIGGSLFVKATATLSYFLTEKNIVDATATAYAMHAKEQKGMAEAQITGAASSYARKYALNGLFLIDDTRDADSQNNDKKGKDEATTNPTPAKPASKELEWLNPGTPNWTYTVQRLKEGVPLETIQKTFRISKENITKLQNEAK